MFSSLRKRHTKGFRTVRRRAARFLNFVLSPFSSLRRTASRSSVQTSEMQLEFSIPSQEELPPQQEIRVSVAIIEHTPEQRSGAVASTSGEESESSVRTARLISIESYEKISPVLEVEEGSTTKEFKDASVQVLISSPDERTINESGGTVSYPGSSQQLPTTSPPSQTDASLIPGGSHPEDTDSVMDEVINKFLKKQSTIDMIKKMFKGKKSADELVEKQTSKKKKPEEELVEEQTSKEKEPVEELVEEQTSKEKAPEGEHFDYFRRVPPKSVQKTQNSENNNKRSVSSSDNSVTNNPPSPDRPTPSGYSDASTLPKDEERERESVDNTIVSSLFDSFADDFQSPLRSPDSDNVFKDETYVDRENITDSDHAFKRQRVSTRSEPGISGYFKEPQPGPSSAGIQATEFKFAQRPELIGATNEVQVQRPEPEVDVSDDEQMPEVEVVPALSENVDRPEAEGTSETADSNTNTSGVASTCGPHLPGTDELLAQVKKRLQKESGAQSDSEVSLDLSEDNPSEPEPQSSTSRQKDDAEPQPSTSRQKDDTEPQTSTSRPEDYYTCVGPIGQREISTSPDDDSLASNISTEPLLGTGKTRKFTKRVAELKHQYSTSSDEGSMRGARPSHLGHHHNSPERHVTPEGEEDYIIPPFLFRIRAPEPPPRSPPDGFSASSGIEEDYNG